MIIENSPLIRMSYKIDFMFIGKRYWKNIFLSFFLAFSINTNAQLDSLFTKIDFGVRLGATLSSSTNHEQVEEVTYDGNLIHNLSNPEARWGQHLGLIFEYRLIKFLTIRTEFNFIGTKVKYNYNTTEYNNEIGLATEKIDGVLEERKLFIQIPLLVKADFYKKKLPEIYGGIYYKGKGLSNGSWSYKERTYAKYLSNSWVFYDSPVAVPTIGESKGFSERNNLGWIVGTEYGFKLNTRLDLLLGIRYQDNFRLDNIYPPYRRHSLLVDFGLMF